MERPSGRRLSRDLTCDPTEAFEDGIPIRLVAACIHLDDPEVGAILDELVPRRGDLEPESAANE